MNFDLRRNQPYSSYEDFEFRVPVETAGDCHARYLVRMVEFRESIRIIRQILDGLPEGPISSRPGVKSLAQVKVPKGEAYARVEGPRGEVGCYLVADGTNKPYRMKWRGASFSNLAVLPHILPGCERRRRRRDHGIGRSGLRRGGSLMPLMNALPPAARRRRSWARAILGALVGILAYVTLLERKFAARLQSRIGPYRVGPHGLLQPIADGVKLLLKEHLVPAIRRIGRSSTSRRSCSWCRAC